MREAQKGVAAMALACTVWGLSALYYRQLAHVPPLEVLAHRTLWSLVFFGLVLAVQGRLPLAFALAGGREAGRVAVAAVFVSSNWFLFIWSVQTGHTVEASLGYYIFPLVAVLIGLLAFGERLSVGQGVAVALAVLAVAVLTLGLGVAPWVALALALTFGVYGLLKKRLAAGPVVSVTAEVLLLAPLALGWLAAVHLGWAGEGRAGEGRAGEGRAGEGRAGGWFGANLATSLMLAFSGVLTAGPLVLFSYASRRIGMATLGLVQYLNPTLQFLVAVAVFGEAFTRWHAVAFGLIWAALLIYTAESLRQDRAARSAAPRAGTSRATVK